MLRDLWPTFSKVIYRALDQKGNKNILIIFSKKELNIFRLKIIVLKKKTCCVDFPYSKILIQGFHFKIFFIRRRNLTQNSFTERQRLGSTFLFYTAFLCLCCCLDCVSRIKLTMSKSVILQNSWSWYCLNLWMKQRN